LALTAKLMMMMICEPAWRRRCLATLPDEERALANTLQQRNHIEVSGRNNDTHG
jgi:hypothetical protein